MNLLCIVEKYIAITGSITTPKATIGENSTIKIKSGSVLKSG